MSIITTGELQDEVDEFEQENEQLLAAINAAEDYADEDGVLDSILRMFDMPRSDYDEYLDKIAAIEAVGGGSEVLVSDEDWVNYVQGLLEDIGEVNVPDYVVIDWDATAANIQQDYISIDIGTTTYWYRSC